MWTRIQSLDQKRTGKNGSDEEEEGDRKERERK